MFNWTGFHIEYYIMNRFEEMVIADNKPIMTSGYPIFGWSPRLTILDNDEDEN